MQDTSRRNRVVSNFLALGILQGANFLLPVLVMPFMLHRIGADGYGVIAVAQVVMLIFSTIADYGFNLTATRAIALHKEDTERNGRLFCTVLACKLLICSVLLVVLLLLITCIPFFNRHFALYLMGFTWVVGQALLVSWFFQGLEKMRYITIFTLLARVLFVVLILVFIREKEDNRFFIFFMGAGTMVAGLFSILYAVFVFKLPVAMPAWKDVVKELKEGWPVMLSNISVNTFLTINVFILRLFTNDLVAGYYSIAEKIFLAVRQIPVIFSQVIYPPLCQLIHEGKQSTSEFFKAVYYPFVLLVFTGSILLFWFAPFVVYLFLGNGVDLAVFLLRLFCLAPVIVCLHIPASQLLMAFDRRKDYLRVLGRATFVNLVSNLLLVQVWGATGTVLSILITESFITIAFNRTVFRNDLARFINPRFV